MGIRRFFQVGIDRIQFYYDVFPGLPYQPLPWLGYHEARRGTGCNDRWAAIKSIISSNSVSSALDLGCNVGYFSFSLAELDITTVGVEMDDRFFRIARYAAKIINTKKVGFLNMEINIDTVHLLPKVDLILLLSVWHHWVKYYGLDAATKLLAIIWEHCEGTMFFETGENEMPPSFCLPAMTPTPREWLTNYLSDTCKNSNIHHVGAFKAFAPSGNEKHRIIERNLFLLSRN